MLRLSMAKQKFFKSNSIFMVHGAKELNRCFFEYNPLICLLESEFFSSFIVSIKICNPTIFIIYI